MANSLGAHQDNSLAEQQLFFGVDSPEAKLQIELENLYAFKAKALQIVTILIQQRKYSPGKKKKKNPMMDQAPPNVSHHCLFVFPFPFLTNWD